MQHLRIRLSATLSNKAAPNQPTHAVIKAAGVPLIKDYSYRIPSFLCDYIILGERIFS